MSCLSSSEESHVSDASVTWELPDSLTHEILLKLPLKSVMRCKRVCKAWHHLVTDPYFTNLYSKRPPISDIVISQHQALGKYGDNDCFCVEIGGNGDVTRKPLNLEAVSKDKTTWMNLIGSCDGLLCLIETPWKVYFCAFYRAMLMINSAINDNQVVRIVNPLIGEYMTLPKVRRVENALVVYGFGSTVDGNHYKVIRVAMISSGLQAHILTIGVDEHWRQVENFFSPPRLYSHGVALNGAIHWIGGGVIYAFDILKEKGNCFKLPCVVGRMFPESYLGVWNGHLCITDNSNASQVDIWTMKRYGDVDSWSRDIILRRSIGNHFKLIPITTMRNGDLLISCLFSSKLFLFDSKKKKCVELEHIDNYSMTVVYGFTPSFISPCNIISRQIFHNRYLDHSNNYRLV